MFVFSKKFFILMFCGTIIANSPVFAMDDDSEKSTISALPREITEKVTDELLFNDVLNFSITSKSMRDICWTKIKNSPHFWNRSFIYIDDYKRFMTNCVKQGVMCSSITLYDEKASSEKNNFFQNHSQVSNFFGNIQEMKISTVSMVYGGVLDPFFKDAFTKNPEIKVQFYSWYGPVKGQTSLYLTDNMKKNYIQLYKDKISFDIVQ